MDHLVLQGVSRGKPVRTTVQDKAVPCPPDHVNRVFHAPARNICVVGLHLCEHTWSGFVHAAFVNTA